MQNNKKFIMLCFYEIIFNKTFFFQKNDNNRKKERGSYIFGFFMPLRSSFFQFTPWVYIRGQRAF